MAFMLLAILFWGIAVLTTLEMATFSARRERMVQAAEAGDRRGTLVNAYQRSPADYLAAIQLLATAANFVVGAMIGSNIEKPIRAHIDRLLPWESARGPVSWTISVGLVTVLAIIFTNVLPKHIGFVRANEIALKGAPFMRLWIKATWPVTALIRRTTKRLALIMRVTPDERYRVTERDIDALLVEGGRAGSLDPTEKQLMRRALRLSDTKITDAMTPRESILWVDATWDSETIESYFRKHGKSNYLVCDGHLDAVIGTVRVQDWLLSRRLDPEPPLFAEPNESMIQAMERLQPSDARLLAVRSAGMVQGVLTLNDVLRQLVGSFR